MKAADPLSKLLKNWQPENPGLSEQFVRDTMQQICQTQREPYWKQILANWFEILDSWLPAPEIFVPVAAALILFLGSLQWAKGIQEAKDLAALQWHEQISKPLANESFAGIYIQLTGK